MCAPHRAVRWILAIAFVVEPLVRCAWLAPEHPAFRTWTLWANCDGLVLGALLARMGRAGSVLPFATAAFALLVVGLVALAATPVALVQPGTEDRPFGA